MEQHLGVGTRGVWTAREVRADGLTPGLVRQRLRSGAWQRVHRGVYADGGVDLDALQRAWAAVLAAGPDSAACRRTAARLWRLPLVDDDDPATSRCERRLDDVACPRPLDARGGLHPVRLDLAAEEVVSIAGCRTTTAVRTLWDLSAVLRADALVCVIDAALHRGLVTGSDLQAQQHRRRGHPGVARFRQAVELADGRAESPLESLGRLVLSPVVPLVPQVEVPHLRVRLDLADEEHRFAVEGDGRLWHAGDLMVRRDRERERPLRREGWAIERYGWYDVRRRQEALRQRVLRAWQRQVRRTTAAA